MLDFNISRYISSNKNPTVHTCSQQRKCNCRQFPSSSFLEARFDSMLNAVLHSDVENMPTWKLSGACDSHASRFPQVAINCSQNIPQSPYTRQDHLKFHLNKIISYLIISEIVIPTASRQGGEYSAEQFVRKSVSRYVCVTTLRSPVS